jgi:hypothetical protein
VVVDVGAVVVAVVVGLPPASDVATGSSPTHAVNAALPATTKRRSDPTPR